MDTAEEKVYPITPEEAIHKYRKCVKHQAFPQAPSKKIKTGGIIDNVKNRYFEFVYSRNVKQYFLFINAYINDYLFTSYNVMKIYVICGNMPIFLGKHNIILNGPVYSDLDSPWHNFRDPMKSLGSGYNCVESLESFWESFVEHHGVETFD